ARPAPAREPEALDGAPGRVLRLLLQGRAEARLDGARRAVSRQREARRFRLLQEEHGRTIGADPFTRTGFSRRVPRSRDRAGCVPRAGGRRLTSAPPRRRGRRGTTGDGALRRPTRRRDRRRRATPSATRCTPAGDRAPHGAARAIRRRSSALRRTPAAPASRATPLPPATHAR